MAEVTKAQLADQLTEMTKRASDAESRASTLTTDLENASAALTDARSTISAQARDLETANHDLRAANASLKAYKGSATKARAEATVLKRAQSPEARPIGAMKAPKSPEEAEARGAAIAAAFAQDTTELVFSDGRREIRELAPLTVTGDAWRDTPSGRVLVHEPVLEPGDCARESFELRGFGLLNEAGEQVAYQALPDAITIGRNQRFQLAHNSVKF